MCNNFNDNFGPVFTGVENTVQLSKVINNVSLDSNSMSNTVIVAWKDITKRFREMKVNKSSKCGRNCSKTLKRKE
jgi:hypothetical protein